MTVSRLAFALYGRRAGVIARDGGRLRLTYDADYLDERGATPLSLSMPLTDDSYSNRPIEAYLRGLLPDHADVRQRWARRFGVRDRDTLGLVAAIGLDCAGGAVFAPDDELDDALMRGGEVEPVDEAAIAARLRVLREDDAAWHEDDEHWSLAGGQGKFTLARSGDQWGLATGGAPSTHIVKPGISRLPAQALTEHLSMRALVLAGLDVAESRYLEFEDQPAIVVTRFDRRRARDGRMVRLHQEDLVQTFGLDPSRKYEADQGPGVVRIVGRLRQVAGQESVDRFVDSTIANYLLGAPDGHAKNYAVLLVGRGASLAPLYDVATDLAPVVGKLRFRSVAMAIGGEKRIGEVEGKHWDKFAGVVGRDPDDVRARVRRLAEAIPEAFAQAISELPESVEGRELVESEVLPRIRALDEQTVKGLAVSRRVGSRVTTPFLDTLEG